MTTDFNAQTPVVINLSFPSPEGKRSVYINESLRAEDLPGMKEYFYSLNGGDIAAKKQKLMELATQDLTIEELDAKLKELGSDVSASTVSWPEVLAESLVRYLKEKYSVTTEKEDESAPLIDTSSIQFKWTGVNQDLLQVQAATRYGTN